MGRDTPRISAESCFRRSNDCGNTTPAGPADQRKLAKSLAVCSDSAGDAMSCPVRSRLGKIASTR